MTNSGLILRSLIYFRGVNLAVILGVAVATAVLSGALMVGDSVRGSLTELAVRRLGKIDHAIIGGRFFDASLVERVSASPKVGGSYEIVPAVIVQGGAMLDGGAARTAGLQIIAVGGDWVPVKPGEVILNEEAASALGVAASGVDIVLSVPAEGDVPLDATLAKRSRQDTLAGLRARVGKIETAPGMLALFNPAGGQRTPMTAWVNLNDLQGAVGRQGKINAVFAHVRSPHPDGSKALNLAIREAIRLGDYGLSIAPVPGSTEAAIVSSSTYLGAPVELAADPIAAQSGIPLRKVSVNLLNTVTRLTPEGQSAGKIHYAVAAGISPLDGGNLGDEEIAVNEWTAQRLGAKVGDLITFTFYRRQNSGELAEIDNAHRGFFEHFRVARILPMSGLGADPSLTPIYKGLTDSDTIASWDPPDEVRIDKSLVTDADEAYWKQYRASPKVFVSFMAAQRLWGEAFGNATSLRIPADRADEFSQKLLAAIDPMTMGLMFQPLREQQLAAAGGTTDFGQLFIGFSFFLIIAASLLVAMLLRLGVEQRGRQLGAMSAMGYSPAGLRKLFLIEGMILAVIGGIAGSLLAVGYTWLMMAGLRTWWVGAVGTSAMRLHVEPLTLAIGFVISLVVAFLATLWAIKQVGRASPARLLSGGWEAARPVRTSGGWIVTLLGATGVLMGIGFIAVGSAGLLAEQVAFLAGGGILLVSSLMLVSGLLRPRRRRTVASSIDQLGIRNATRHPARSVLCIGLIALASFALVTVASMRQGEPTDTADPRSGAGGYRLIIDAQIPLTGNPATEQGRSLLGFREPANPIWSRAEFLPLRRQPGQDVSCLNLTRAISPTILAVPRQLIDQGGFAPGDRNPWRVLDEPVPANVIPVLADDSTAKYILHLGIGDIIEVADASGAVRQLRLVGTLPHTVFQSQLMMREEDFRSMFPSQSGFGMVLVKVGAEDQSAVARMLSDELADYAASVQTTASLLASYLEVQNTYLSTFELLGALGLMLGTVGLAVVLVRTVIERQGELALLASVGFPTQSRIRLVLSENVFLLVMGLVLGTVCALIGVIPALSDSSRHVNGASLVLTLIVALLFGLCASGIAVVISGRGITVADLRRE